MSYFSKIPTYVKDKTTPDKLESLDEKFYKFTEDLEEKDRMKKFLKDT